MRINKNLLFAFAFIIVAAIFYGYKTYNKSHKNLNEMKADYVLAPDAFLAEFEADEAAAQTKYLNKIIQLQGDLLEIQTVGNQTIWIISTGNPLSNIQCEMDGRYIQNVSDKVKTGDKVTVQGICSGKLMDIVLNQVVCIL
jgi:hypothetical protein